MLGTGAEKAGLEYCCGNVRRSLGWTGGRLDNCLPEIFLSEIWGEQHFPFVFLALEGRRGVTLPWLLAKDLIFADFDRRELLLPN